MGLVTPFYQITAAIHVNNSLWLSQIHRPEDAHAVNFFLGSQLTTACLDIHS